MSRLHRWLVAFLTVGVIVAAEGCGADTGKGKPADTRSPALYFKEQQSSTMTPHGKIMMDSVEEKDRKIQYKTEDGKTWRVGYSKRADGTYQYGMPEETK